MNTALQQAAEQMISAYCGEYTLVNGYSVLSGGSINNALRISTTAGYFFLKYNNKSNNPGMFEAESKGLSMIQKSNSPRIPNIIGVGESGDNSFLLLEFLDRGRMSENFWEEFGQQLAALHKHTQENFGADHNNYIGLLTQDNTKKSDFITFFIENRLEPQLRMAGKALRHLAPSFESLYKKLPEIIPDEKPALIHGDLWSGNFLIGPQGEPCLIDPAVYYGHREADIAMSKLFGGFDEEFYAAYNNSFALSPGWKERVDIFNLYPLLVHMNLFGGGYVRQVEEIAKNF